MRVLHVDANPKRTNSSSKMLSAHFMQQLKQIIPDMAVDYLDIAAHTPPHISHAFIEAMYTPRPAEAVKCSKCCHIPISFAPAS